MRLNNFIFIQLLKCVYVDVYNDFTVIDFKMPARSLFLL